MSRGPLKGMRAVLFTEVLGLSANYFMPFHGDTARATLWSLHKSEALTKVKDQLNKKLNGTLETIFINTRSENMYLSSSVVKQICELGGDISDFVPEAVRDDIVKRIMRGA